MRISSQQMQNVGMKSLMDQQTKLNKVQLQLSSGKRILVPSDDPTASAMLTGMSQSLEVFNQYQDNILLARSRLQLEESTLGGVTNVLQRVRELAVQANNDTLNPEEKAGIAAEVRARLDEILGLANTTDSNGDYLFSGYKGNTIPFSRTGGSFGVSSTFSYHGDQGQRNIQVGPERQVADADHGFNVFMKIAGGDLFSAVEELAVVIEQDITAGSNTNMTGARITRIDEALEKVLQVRSTVGARLNALDGQQDVNADYILRMESTMSDIRDLDYAEAVAEMNLQMAGLQAAQQTYMKVQNLSLFNYL